MHACACAQATRLAYEQQLVQIMNQYGVVSEAELVSGCISKFAKHRGKKGDVKRDVGDAVHALRKKFLRCGGALVHAGPYGVVENPRLLHLRIFACLHAPPPSA